MAFSLSLPATMGSSLRAPGSVTTIEHDGIYHVDTSHTRLALSLATPLKLNDSVQFDRVYIEQRHLTKFDRRLHALLGKELKDASRTQLRSHAHGAFLYLGSSHNSANSTQLIDANPQLVGTDYGNRSARLAELSDSTLLPGKAFKIFETSVTVEVTRVTPTSLTIEVAGLTH
jgi:hypothetical protein